MLRLNVFEKQAINKILQKYLCQLADIVLIKGSKLIPKASVNDLLSINKAISYNLKTLIRSSSSENANELCRVVDIRLMFKMSNNCVTDGVLSCVDAHNNLYFASLSPGPSSFHSPLANPLKERESSTVR